MKVSRYRIVSNYWKNLTNDCCVFEGKVTSMEFRLTSEQYGRVVNSSSLLFIVVSRNRPIENKSDCSFRPSFPLLR